MEWHQWIPESRNYVTNCSCRHKKQNHSDRSIGTCSAHTPHSRIKKIKISEWQENPRSEWIWNIVWEEIVRNQWTKVIIKKRLAKWKENGIAKDKSAQSQMYIQMNEHTNMKRKTMDFPVDKQTALKLCSQYQLRCDFNAVFRLVADINEDRALF